MAFSRFGRKLIIAHLVLLILCAIVLAFSTRVNLFTDWFYKADLFPFGLSIATMAIIGVLLIIDCVSTNAYTGRAQFEFVVLGLLSVFWLGFNAFTTSRYKHVPFQCFSIIPENQPAMRSWCINVQVVKAFMWIVWAFITLLLLSMGRFTQSEISKGNKHILKMPLSRYDPDNVGPSVSTAYPFAPGYGNAGGVGSEKGISNPTNPKLFPYPDEDDTSSSSSHDVVMAYAPQPHQQHESPGFSPHDPQSYGSGQSTGTYLQQQFYAESSGYTASGPGPALRSPHYHKTTDNIGYGY